MMVMVGTAQVQLLREKAGGRYATGLLLQLPARVRFRCDFMAQSLREFG